MVLSCTLKFVRRNIQEQLHILRQRRGRRIVYCNKYFLHRSDSNHLVNSFLTNLYM
ncbi:hypothetical protein C0J52_20051 [Blattella germanica]|nr:hypothetical protein C0J52_20051 [Blattella germanica]